MSIDTVDTKEAIREQVRERYAEAARTVTEGSRGSCGSGSCCDNDPPGAFGEVLYSSEERGELPDAAALASLGCGNPTAVADLNEGEVVLDLGSGGGIDVILSAKRVGPTGTAYGLDMTDEMLALAQQNAREAGIPNVHFLKGLIEAIRFRRTRSTSSSPTASSTSRPTSRPSSPRSHASCGRAAGSGSRTSSPRIASAPRSASSAAISPAASPARSPSASTRPASRPPASRT